MAHMASLRFPLSIPGLVTRIQPDSESFDTHYSSTVVDVQDACLAMSVISWDPEVVFCRSDLWCECMGLI